MEETTEQGNSAADNKNQNSSSEKFMGWHVAKVYDLQEKAGKKYQEVLIAKQVSGQEKDQMQRLRVSEKFIESVNGLKNQNLIAFSAYKVNINFTAEGSDSPIKKSFLQAARPVIKLSETRNHKLTGRLTEDPIVHTLASGRVARFDLAINRGDKDTIYHHVNSSDKFVDNVEKFKKGDLVSLSGFHAIKRSGNREFHIVQLSAELKKFEQKQEHTKESSPKTDKKVEKASAKTKGQFRKL